MQALRFWAAVVPLPGETTPKQTPERRESPFQCTMEWMTRDQAITEITRRLVDYFHPERIYLFGSAARGDGGPDSDLDFCVVLPDDAPERLYRPGIHRVLWGVGTAADVVRWP